MKAMLVALLLLHQLFGALAYHTHTYAGQTASVSAAFGDGTDARGSRIFDVRKIWKNQQGSLFLVDAGHQLVRMVSSSGILSTIAGGGANRGNTTTFPLPALSVKFSDLYGIAGDNNGHLFLSEKSPCVIRRLTAEGSSAFADIIAGQYGRCGYNGSPDPLSANFYSPSGIYYSAGMLYVADTLNHIIQAIALDSQGNALDVRLLAGVPGSSGYIDPTDITLLRLLNRPQDVFVNGNSVYIADTYNCMVRVYTGDMNMLGIAIGKQDSCATSVVEGSLYSSTPLYYPDAICGDVDTGNLYVSQMYNGYKVRVVDKVYTVTGSSGSSIRRTGPYARTTRVGDSFGCLVDKNVLHFADPVNGYVFQTPYPSTNITSVVGFMPGQSIPSESINFTDIRGLWGNTLGELYVTDFGLHHIGKISADGETFSSVAGVGVGVSTGAVAAATISSLYQPYDVIGEGNYLYFTEYGGYRIKRFGLTNNTIVTIAGTGLCGNGAQYSGPAASSSVCYPSSMTMDPLNRVLYFMDTSYSLLRAINLAFMTISTVTTQSSMASIFYSSGTLFVGLGSQCRVMSGGTTSTPFTLYPYAGSANCTYNGENKLGTSANIGIISSMCGDSTGRLFVSEQTTACRTRHVDVDPYFAVTTFAGDGICGASGEYVPTTARVGVVRDCFMDNRGILYTIDVVDTLNPDLIRIRRTLTAPTSQPSSCPSAQPSMQPSKQPVAQPSGQPSRQPQAQPTAQPSKQPIARPSAQPSAQPTKQPISDPSSQPSTQPSKQPISRPSAQPSRQPSMQPSSQPLSRPSTQPTSQPTFRPSMQPSSQPSTQPRAQPSSQPSVKPSRQPSSQPSSQPQSRPTGQPSRQPNAQPSAQPSGQPAARPSAQPTMQPSTQPQARPSAQPSRQPTRQPQSIPTSQPSRQPTGQPSLQPSARPSQQPVGQPSSQPSRSPSRQPSSQPSRQPSCQPQGSPTSQPSAQPSQQPVGRPSAQPSMQPSRQPQARPSGQPSGQPSRQPQSRPTSQPSCQPTCQPQARPTSQPSGQPSQQPAGQPTGQPSGQPSLQPYSQPSSQPSCQPQGRPSAQPSAQPQARPTGQPSIQPSRQPSQQPTARPSMQPSRQPTLQPQARPTGQPSTQPSLQPAGQPTGQPSRQPSMQPSAQPQGRPSGHPSCQPSSQPSRQPTLQPLSRPTSQPSRQPTCQPSSQPSARPSQQPVGQPSSQPSRSPSTQPSSQPSRQPSCQPQARPSSQPSIQPSRQPSAQPSRQPLASPSSQPSSQPSRKPSGQPSSQPSVQPVAAPSAQPSRQPTAQPVGDPSSQPSGQPTRQPSSRPTVQPSAQPSRQPSMQPSSQPVGVPTGQPSRQPTSQPSRRPSAQPSRQPSGQPTRQPSSRPTVQPSGSPTMQPSVQPSAQPFLMPTGQPSRQPTRRPSSRPSSQPSEQPSRQPSTQPSRQPSMQPSVQPSSRPSRQPSSRPSSRPSAQPSAQPSRQPTARPSKQPSSQPSRQPSMQPTVQPSNRPSRQPSAQPSTQPSSQPSAQPFLSPTGQPTMQPSRKPSSQPSRQPSAQPSTQPSGQPNVRPSSQPTCQPSQQPSGQPSLQPISNPTAQPSAQPSLQPQGRPSGQPSRQPSRQPSTQPSRQPTSHPTVQPSVQPSAQPSVQPIGQPTGQPSSRPSSRPSAQPSRQPTSRPSTQPSAEPSAQPVAHPTAQPSSRPSAQPVQNPTSQPSRQPSGQPSVQPSRQPTSQPSRHPSSQPSRQPSSRPSAQPTGSPTSQPSGSPSCQPSVRPSAQPSSRPSAQPTRQPSTRPSSQPSTHPSTQPSEQPSGRPSRQPSRQPTSIPSGRPTSQPSHRPSAQPSVSPSRQPSSRPSSQPSRVPTARPSSQPSIRPSGQPSRRPSSQPSRQPTVRPTTQPSSRPSTRPSSHPSAQPSRLPTAQPTTKPSSRPSTQPSAAPSSQPSTTPTNQPNCQPTTQPSSRPSVQPSNRPSRQPSGQPTGSPTLCPSAQPSQQPSAIPTSQPSGQPSLRPSTQPSSMPSVQPSMQPTAQPSSSPTVQPSAVPTLQPTGQPSSAPTASPSAQPSSAPSVQPSTVPTVQPSSQPSIRPSAQPSDQPSSCPSTQPSEHPSSQPSGQPSRQPSGRPSQQPSGQPIGRPSVQPTVQPTSLPSAQPSNVPTAQPSVAPSTQPSSAPSGQPSSRPSGLPSAQPGAQPSSQPSRLPCAQPSSQPSSSPSSFPSAQPSAVPSVQPSSFPSSHPSSHPSAQPSPLPSSQPTVVPSSKPTAQPSRQPSSCPSSKPSSQPSASPSSPPTGKPSLKPSSQPSAEPSARPSAQPSMAPTSQPSSRPSSRPSSYPSSRPSSRPSRQPTGQPSALPSSRPSATPSAQPSRAPSGQPSSHPTVHPSSQPSQRPSTQPTARPSSQPSRIPSSQPVARPSAQPSSRPTAQPSTQPTIRPSAHPSAQPSSSPSSLPSQSPVSMPTAGPSSQPSSSPASSPSSHPSNQPTSSPTASPSSNPTGQPFEQPSMQPTSKPSFRPSGQPTEQPSSKPSVMPSSRPTRIPTAQPSSSPTSQPQAVPSAPPSPKPSPMPTTLRPTLFIGATNAPSTQAPSLSLTELWNKKLGSDLQSVGLFSSSKVVTKKTYYDLFVGGSVVYGSCAAWQGWLSGDVLQTSQSYVPATVQYFSRASLSDSGFTLSCSNKTVVHQMISALTSSASDASWMCDSTQWRVKSCAASDQQALCLNCADPCALSAMRIAPCSANYPLTSPAIDMLAIEFNDIDQPPAITNIAVNTQQTAAQVAITLDKAGTAYCAVDLSSAAAPTSVDQIALQNLAQIAQSDTATLQLQRLDAMTAYRVYCFAQSIYGSRTAIANVQSKAFSTACCRTVFVQMTSSSISEGKDVSKFVTLKVNGGAVRNMLTVQLTAQKVISLTNLTVVSTVKAAFSPSSYSFTKGRSPSAAAMVSGLAKLANGVYLISANLTGASAVDYSVQFGESGATYALLQVLSVLAPLPAPALVSAVLESDGSKLSIAFSADTDRGGGNVQFACHSLFAFPCANVSSCQWTGFSTVIATLASRDDCAAPKDRLLLSKTAAIKARCTASNCTAQSTWPKLLAGNVSISAPLAPISPLVIISAMDTVGSCSSLTLDLTSSSGNGGRSWKSLAMNVSSIDVNGNQGNTSALQALLARYSMFPPTVIPSALLQAGQIYTFQVRLCNFLGVCASATKRVTVLNTLIPVVAIAGDGLRTIKRMTPLSVSAQGILPACTGNITTGLVYNWTISQSGSPLLSLGSSSKDPSRMLLPAYSLTANSMYEVSVKVSIASQSSTASMRVFATAGDIVAVVGKGLVRSVRVGQNMTIDASGSYDEGVNGVASLRFAWACVQTAPSLNNSCWALFAASAFMQSQSAAVLQVQALSTASTEGISEVTVLVQDNARARSASAVIVVTVLPSLAPVITLSSLPVLSGKINANQPLQLIGTVNVPAQFSGTVAWLLDASAGRTLSSVVTGAALNASFIGLPASTGTKSLSFYLPITTSLLPAGQSLLFSLACSLTGIASASSSIAVTVNAPPRPGIFLVSPPSEVELSFVFTFSCDRWIDDDLPLFYQFGFLSTAGQEMIVRSKQSTAFAYSVLPAGLASNDHYLTSVVQVLDVLRGQSQASFPVQVLENEQMDSAAVESYIADSMAAGSNSVDGIKQASSMSTYLLNRINCSLALNCSQLHRQACYRTPHTCGPCLSDEYLGDAGDSNQQCHHQSAAPAPPGGSDVPKPCPANCSSHGDCQYFSSVTGEPLSICASGALSCVSSCSCHSGYHGSACALSTADMERKFALREQVIAGLEKLITLEDVDAESMQALITSVSAASQSADELSADASKRVLDLAVYTLSNIQSTGLASDAANGLLSSIQSCLTASSSSARRRRLAGNGSAADYDSSVAGTTLQALEHFSSFVSSNLAPGQDAINHVNPSFRMQIAKFGLSDQEGCAGNASLAFPSTASERSLGAQAGALTVPLCGNQSSLSVSTTSLSGSLFSHYLDGRMQSDPISLSFSSYPCSSSSSSDPAGCMVDLVLSRQRYANRSYVEPEAMLVNVTCQGRDELLEHTCADGHSYSVHCNESSKVIQVSCPVTVDKPSCNALIGFAEVDYGCVVKAYTADNVTCSCPLLRSAHLAGSTAGHLHAAAAADNSSVVMIPSGTITVNYLSMLSAVTSSFTSTVLSAQGLNGSTVSEGYRALVTVGVFLCTMLAAMVYSHHADNQAKKVEPARKKQSQEEQKAKGAWLDSLLVISRGRGRGKQRSRHLKQKKEKQGFLDMAQAALPDVLSNRSTMTKLREELKRHHRWAGVVFHYSDKMPRILRVASLATNIIVMLFMQSVTYNLTNGDDGSCERLTTVDTCLEPSSAYATGDSKCYWTPAGGEASAAGNCAYQQPNDSIKVVLFVAIFSALVTTPIAMAADYVIFKYLAAPTARSGDAQQQLMRKRSKGQLTAIVPAPASVPAVRRSRGGSLITAQAAAGSQMVEGAATGGSKLEELQHAQDDFVALVQGLRRYLKKLNDEDKEEFRSLWGLTADGDFIVSKPSIWTRLGLQKVKGEEQQVASLVLADILHVQHSYTKELQAMTKKDSSSGHATYRNDLDKNKRLLYLFQKDLLPGICGQILESKDMRDHQVLRGVSRTAKTIGWVFLAVLNMSLLFYVFLFATSQDSSRQSAWAQSFAMWLVLEILIVSTSMVLFMHVLIPSLIRKDVQKIKAKLVDSLVQYHHYLTTSTSASNDPVTAGGQTQAQQGNGHGPHPLRRARSHVVQAFNAAQHLFVSYKLAADLPHLKIAKIISHYETVWPRQSYQHSAADAVTKTYDRKYAALTRSVSIVVMFFVTNLLSVPLTVQDMVMQMVSTAVTGYTLLVHIQLFQIFPVLVVIPTLFLAVIVHFLYTAASQRSGKDDLQMLLKEGLQRVQQKQHHKQQLEEGEQQEKGAGSDEEYSCSSDSSSGWESESSLASGDIRSMSMSSNDELLLHRPAAGHGRRHHHHHDDDGSSSSRSSSSVSSSSEEEDEEDGVELFVQHQHQHHRAADSVSITTSRHKGRRESVTLGLQIAMDAQKSLLLLDQRTMSRYHPRKTVAAQEDSSSDEKERQADAQDALRNEEMEREEKEGSVSGASASSSTSLAQHQHQQMMAYDAEDTSSIDLIDSTQVSSSSSSDGSESSSEA